MTLKERANLFTHGEIFNAEFEKASHHKSRPVMACNEVMLFSSGLTKAIITTTSEKDS